MFARFARELRRAVQLVVGLASEPHERVDAVHEHVLGIRVGREQMVLGCRVLFGVQRACFLCYVMCMISSIMC